MTTNFYLWLQWRNSLQGGAERVSDTKVALKNALEEIAHEISSSLSSSRFMQEGRQSRQKT